MDWRLIPLLDAPGRFQMALDVWLLKQHRLGLQPSVLRFYTWSPVAISLGYHQHQSPVAWQQLTWQGAPIELVRRPTGGRAVLHQGDLTYGVITSQLSGDRQQTYQAICEFLIQGWRRLGVELQYGDAGRGYIHNPNCFGTATAADLVLANGGKLIGSAQLRHKGAILQHGSMRLEPDACLFSQVFGPEALPLPDLPVSTTGRARVQDVIQALMDAAALCFGTHFTVEPLSDAERQAVLSQSGLEEDAIATGAGSSTTDSNEVLANSGNLSPAG